MVDNALWDGLKVNGIEELCIYKHKIGTHLIRLRSAMAMCLGGVPEYAIMLIGWWGRNLFMKYIQKQIEEFSIDVSKKMLRVQTFRHTPHQAPNQKKTEYGGCAQLMLSKGNLKVT